jgi:hypothetical protein
MDPAQLIAARTMQSLYVWLDLAFLVAFAVVLVWSRRYQALVAGLVGGVSYYRVLGTRVIHGADPFWFLLWLSVGKRFLPSRASAI